MTELYSALTALVGILRRILGYSPEMEMLPSQIFNVTMPPGIPLENFNTVANPNLRITPRTGSKRPARKPFKTVLVTSSPIHALARPPRLHPKPSLSHTLQGIGFGGPSIDIILVHSPPRTRPPFSKSKVTGYQKGLITKRPTKFFTRTTKQLPHGEGSKLFPGWFDTQRIWPAVGLNYSI